MAEHALISYVLQNIAWAVSDLTLQQKAHHLHLMKCSYSKMSIGTSISSETFNFSMILLVKSVAYFLSNHVKVVLVDLALECDIYRQTLLGILGTSPSTQVWPNLVRNRNRTEYLPYLAEDVQKQAGDCKRKGECVDRPC